MQHLINEAKCSEMQSAPSMHHKVYLGECITMQVNVAGRVNAAIMQRRGNAAYIK